MIEAENRLIKWFSDGFWIHLVAIIGFAIVIILLIIFRNKLIEAFQNKTINGSQDTIGVPQSSRIGKVIFLVLLIMLIAISGFFSYRFALYAMDKKAVNNREFAVVTGKVISYTGLREGNDPQDPIYSRAIIITESGETIKLKLNDVALNETYTFVYLKNTTLAVTLKE